MPQFYKQARLKKGSTTQVAYIPEQFAKVGKYLRLENEDGWQVIVVNPERRSTEWVLAKEREHTKNREASDI